MQKTLFLLRQRRFSSKSNLFYFFLDTLSLTYKRVFLFFQNTNMTYDLSNKKVKYILFYQVGQLAKCKEKTNIKNLSRALHINIFLFLTIRRSLVHTRTTSKYSLSLVYTFYFFADLYAFIESFYQVLFPSTSQILYFCSMRSCSCELNKNTGLRYVIHIDASREIKVCENEAIACSHKSARQYRGVFCVSRFTRSKHRGALLLLQKICERIKNLISYTILNFLCNSYVFLFFIPLSFNFFTFMFCEYKHANTCF